ncbi:MAG: cytochrome P450 [Alphaproteobacteria bacterium]|nr:cytochrome P450 [Alphaproteobacteria bacterium]MCB9791484.1 cytochrome P450 [Alphaproteobacteria bacterium]
MDPAPRVHDPLSGPEGLPVLGVVVDYVKGPPYRYLERAARAHGDIVQLNFAGDRLLFLVHPSHVQQLLVEHAKHTRKDPVTRSMVAFLGEGLLTADNSAGLRQRRRLAAAVLGAGQVDRYADTILRHTRAWLASLTEGEPFDLHTHLMGLTLSIAAETLFGVTLEEGVDLLAEDLDVFLRYFQEYGQGWKQLLPAWMPTPMRGQLARSLSRFDDRLYQLIAARSARTGEGGDDALHRLILARDAEGGLSDTQLRDDAATLLLAGHETTALNLGFALLLLSQHPEVAERLRAELDGALQGAPPRPEALAELPYLDAVNREALRLYPPAWAMGRQAIAPFELDGVPVAVDDTLMVSPWVTQRDPRWFADPEAFRPERWLDGALEDLPRFAFFPFGGGGRVCVGMHFALLEAKLVLAQALQTWRFEVQPPSALQSGVTLRPVGGLGAVVR